MARKVKDHDTPVCVNNDEEWEEITSSKVK